MLLLILHIWVLFSQRLSPKCSLCLWQKAQKTQNVPFKCFSFPTVNVLEEKLEEVGAWRSDEPHKEHLKLIEALHLNRALWSHSWFTDHLNGRPSVSLHALWAAAALTSDLHTNKDRPSCWTRNFSVFHLRRACSSTVTRQFNPVLGIQRWKC